MNKQEIENIYKDAYDVAILILSDIFKDKNLIPNISEGEIMDKKYKSGIYKGINICIEKIRQLRKNE